MLPQVAFGGGKSVRRRGWQWRIAADGGLFFLRERFHAAIAGVIAPRIDRAGLGSAGLFDGRDGNQPARCRGGSVAGRLTGLGLGRRKSGDGRGEGLAVGPR